MTPTFSMASIITAIGSLVTASVDWISTTVGAFTATGNEVLLFSLLVSFVGVGIGLTKRALRLRA